MSSSEENAERIGELQAKVAQLEGAAQSRETRLLEAETALDTTIVDIGELQARVTFLMGALSAAQESTIRLQALEMGRMQERIDAGTGK